MVRSILRHRNCPILVVFDVEATQKLNDIERIKSIMSDKRITWADAARALYLAKFDLADTVETLFTYPVGKGKLKDS